MLALDPPEPGATLGGIVSANASGPRRLRYGTARDLLIGVTVAGRKRIYASTEDMVTLIAGPRVGKSTAYVIPAIADAPGAVLTVIVAGIGVERSAGRTASPSTLAPVEPGTASPADPASASVADEAPLQRDELRTGEPT